MRRRDDSIGHVARLGTQLSAKLGTFDEGCGTPTQAGGFTYEQCRKEVNIPFAAGVGIGATSFTLDVLARDRRVTLSYVNPARLSGPVGAFGDTHAACPLDYFEASVADPLRAKLGPPGRVRTTSPVCGEVMTDVRGSQHNAPRSLHPLKQ